MNSKNKTYGSERIVKFGLVEIRGIRRKRPIKEFDELNQAITELKTCLMDTPFVRAIKRFVEWLNRKL